jgi:hypothetical protein
MDALDRFWQWADKPPESPLTIRPNDIEQSWRSLLRTGGTAPR